MVYIFAPFGNNRMRIICLRYFLSAEIRMIALLLLEISINTMWSNKIVQFSSAHMMLHVCTALLVSLSHSLHRRHSFCIFFSTVVFLFSVQLRWHKYVLHECVCVCACIEVYIMELLLSRFSWFSAFNMKFEIKRSMLNNTFQQQWKSTNQPTSQPTTTSTIENIERKKRLRLIYGSMPLLNETRLNNCLPTTIVSCAVAIRAKRRQIKSLQMPKTSKCFQLASALSLASLLKSWLFSLLPTFHVRCTRFDGGFFSIAVISVVANWSLASFKQTAFM